MARKFTYYSILDTEIIILKMYNFSSKMWYSAAGFWSGLAFFSFTDCIIKNGSGDVFLIPLICLLFAILFGWLGYKDQKCADKIFTTIESESRVVE